MEAVLFQVLTWILRAFCVMVVIFGVSLIVMLVWAEAKDHNDDYS